MNTTPGTTVTRDTNGNYLFPASRYTPRYKTWPYTLEDFERFNEDPDNLFWSTSEYRVFIHHETIERLRNYYARCLPRTGRILDLCAGLRSYLPYELEVGVWSNTLKVVGVGLNLEELRVNSVLQTESSRKVHDLNKDPNVYHAVSARQFDAVTCVVSIMYLTSPLQVLKSLRSCMVGGGRVHIIVNTMCVKDKTIKKWMTCGVVEGLRMVRDYLHFAGYKDIYYCLLQNEEGLPMAPNYKTSLWVVCGTSEERHCNGWHDREGGQEGSSDEDAPEATEDDGILASSSESVSADGGFGSNVTQADNSLS